MAYFPNQPPAYVNRFLLLSPLCKEENTEKAIPTRYGIKVEENKPERAKLWRVSLTASPTAGHGNLGSKYIYELYYEKEAISKPLYDWLLKNNYADANLIAKWKKQGYEKVGFVRFSYLPRPPFGSSLFFVFRAKPLPLSHAPHPVLEDLVRTKLTLSSIAGIVMLPALHPNQRNEFQRDLHMSSAKGAAEGRPDDRVRGVWVSGVFVE